MIKLKEIVMILSCVILNSIAQIFLKLGMNSMGRNFSASGFSNIPSLISNSNVVIGGVLYAVSFVVWLYVLSKVKLSYAYPFISLSYVIVVILGLFILNEKISSAAWLGILLVVIGVSLIGMNIGN